MQQKKELGQHFLKDRSIAQQIVESSRVGKEDTVLEIGGGAGILTQYLAMKAKRVIVVEVDPRFARLLTVRFKEEKHIEIVEDNILNFSPKQYQLEKAKYLLIGSLPYNISKQIIKKFLEEDIPPAHLTVVVQKEVAFDYLAKPPKASFLSNYLHIWGEATSGQVIPKEEFQPVPKVDGAVLHIKMHFKQIPHAHQYARFLKSAFLNPRKKLINNLAGNKVSKEELRKQFTTYGIRLDARASMLTFKQWQQLFTFLQ